MRACVAVALTACLLAAAPAGAQPADLGSYERSALEVALERRKLELDPAPAGKTVRAIHVVNLDVFGKDEGFLQWFNNFHRTTREFIIEREVFLRPGDTWDDEVVEDNRRRLNDQLFTTLVVMVPVKADGEGQVDLLVVTRDLWSLRMNSNIEVQQQTITELLLSISENNFLGWRKQMSVVFEMNEGDWSLGPLYIDKNVLGTRLQVRSRFEFLFRRGTDAGLLRENLDLNLTGDFEGTQSRTDVVYPLWSLSRQWGAGIVLAHFDGVQRRFQGLQDPPDLAGRIAVRRFSGADGEHPSCELAPEGETIPQEWERSTAEIDGVVTRSIGKRVKHRMSWGYELRTDTSNPPDDLVADPNLIECFERDVLPRSELSSSLTASYSLFTPRYVRYKNIDTYDLREDATLGPSVAVGSKLALETIGSDTNFADVSFAAAYTLDWAGDGLVRPSFGTGTRIQQKNVAEGEEVGGLIDNSIAFGIRVVSPRVGDAVRFVGESSIAARWDVQSNSISILGGSNGLRGYPVNRFFTGFGADNQRSFRANVEVRTMPIEILFARAGALAFYDVGGVDSSFAKMFKGAGRYLADDPDLARGLFQDVGIGLRALVPQLQPYVFRLDWAVPLNGPNSGLSNSRVIFASMQAF